MSYSFNVGSHEGCSMLIKCIKPCTRCVTHISPSKYLAFLKIVLVAEEIQLMQWVLVAVVTVLTSDLDSNDAPPFKNEVASL